MPRAECTFKPQINKTSSSLAQKTAAISFRHGRRPGADTEATPPKRWGARTAHAGYLTMFFLFVGIWLIFYKIFDDESGIKLEKTCESLGSEDMNWGFSWYPKMLQVTWQPVEFEARFFFADPWACFRPTRRRMSCDSALIGWMSQWFPSISSMFISKVSWFIHGSIKCPETIEN